MPCARGSTLTSSPRRPGRSRSSRVTASAPCASSSKPASRSSDRPPSMTWVDDASAALFTDLYELTMAASYHAHGLDEPGTFDLFARDLPPKRGYLVSCGLDTALDYLEKLHFDDDSLAYLRSLDLFDESFLSRLGGLRFTGEVWAIPEGELVFPSEPIVQVTAPLVEAQIVETFLLNCLGYQTMIATKAARVGTACDGRTFVDFSPRRDHGTDAAMKTARAAYIGGASGTSLVLAGKAYGLSLSGTMAHSYIMRFASEADAFLTYARDFPGRAIFLIDTQLGTSGDAPHVGVVYKLVQDASGPKVKLSTDKVTLPGRKQIFRRIDDTGALGGDVLALQDESVTNARPVLRPVMRDGRRTGEREPLDVPRDRRSDAVAALPERLRALEPEGPAYEVQISPGLDALVHRLHEQLAA